VVHLAAPGQSIVSTSSGNRLSKASGSSQAAAFVSGAAALLFSMYERVSAEDVKERLIYTADLLPALEGEVVSGRLNVRRAAEYFNRDVVRLKTEQSPLVGRLRRCGGVFLFGPDELIREGGEYVRASRIRRIVYHKETEDYTVLAVGDHGFQRFSHVKFQPADSPAYQNEDDKLSMKVDGRWRRIRLSNIVDLTVAAPL
jgi:hypothetical protein